MKRKLESLQPEIILSAKGAKTEGKKEDVTKDFVTKISNDYFELIKKFGEIVNGGRNSSFLEEFYPKVVQNRCEAGDLYKDSDPEKALAVYQMALEHFEEWDKYKTLQRNSPTENKFRSYPLYINQDAVLHYNLFLLYSKRENFSDLVKAAEHLQIAILDYQWLMASDSEKGKAYVEGLIIALKNQKEINQKIEDLQKKENISQADNFSISSTSTPVSSIHMSEYASLVLKSIKDNQKPNKIIIKCQDDNQMRGIKNWLSREKSLTICVKPYLSSNEQFELVAEREMTVFHLKQWQRINDKIIDCLEKKNYLALFESVSNQNASSKKILSVGKRLKIIELYFTKLLPRISQKDIPSFREVYSDEKRKLGDFSEKSKAKYEQEKEKKKKKRLSKKYSQKTVPSMTPPDSSENNAMLFSQIQNISEQPILSQMESSNTNPIILNFGNPPALGKFNPELRQESQPEVNFLCTTTIQNPPNQTNIQPQPLVDLETGPSSASRLPKWIKIESTTTEISEAQVLQDEKEQQLMNGLKSRIQDTIKKINDTHKENDITSNETFSLTATESLDALRKKNKNYGQYLNNLQSKIKWEKQSAITEIMYTWDAVLDLKRELKFDSSIVPKLEKLNEFTKPQLLTEKERVRSEFDKLKKKKIHKFIRDITSCDEELTQLNKIDEEDNQSFRVTK